MNSVQRRILLTRLNSAVANRDAHPRGSPAWFACQGLIDEIQEILEGRRPMPTPHSPPAPAMPDQAVQVEEKPQVVIGGGKLPPGQIGPDDPRWFGRTEEEPPRIVDPRRRGGRESASSPEGPQNALSSARGLLRAGHRMEQRSRNVRHGIQAKERFRGGGR